MSKKPVAVVNSAQHLKDRQERIRQQKLIDCIAQEDQQRLRLVRSENRTFVSMMTNHDERLKMFKSFTVCNGCGRWIGDLPNDSSGSNNSPTSPMATSPLWSTLSASLTMSITEGSMSVVTSDCYVCVDCLDCPSLCARCVTGSHFEPIDIVSSMNDVEVVVEQSVIAQQSGFSTSNSHSCLRLDAAHCSSVKGFLPGVKSHIHDLRRRILAELGAKADGSFSRSATPMPQGAGEESGRSTPTASTASPRSISPGLNRVNAPASVSVDAYMSWSSAASCSLEAEEKKRRMEIERAEFRYSNIKCSKVLASLQDNTSMKTTSPAESPAPTAARPLSRAARLKAGASVSPAPLSLDATIANAKGELVLDSTQVMPSNGEERRNSLQLPDPEYVPRFLIMQCLQGEALCRAEIEEAHDAPLKPLLEASQEARLQDTSIVDIVVRLAASSTTAKAVDSAVKAVHFAPLEDQYRACVEVEFEMWVSACTEAQTAHKAQYDNDAHLQLHDEEYIERYRLYMDCLAALHKHLLPFLTVRHSMDRRVTLIDLYEQHHEARNAVWRSAMHHRLPIGAWKLLSLKFITNRKMMNRLESLVDQGIEAQKRAAVMLEEEDVRITIRAAKDLDYNVAHEAETRNRLLQRFAVKRMCFFCELEEHDLREIVLRDEALDRRAVRQQFKFLVLDLESLQANLPKVFTMFVADQHDDLQDEDQHFLSQFYPSLLPPSQPSLADGGVNGISFPSPPSSSQGGHSQQDHPLHNEMTELTEFAQTKSYKEAEEDGSPVATATHRGRAAPAFRARHFAGSS